MSTDSDDSGELPDEGDGGCPNRRRGFVFVNTETGQIAQPRCGRNSCSYCLPLNARERARAMAWAGCQRSITITEVAEREDPAPWQTIRRRVNRVREYLKREGIEPGMWGVFAEAGGETGMRHAHIAQQGDRPIPKVALQAAAHRAGAGWTRIERIRGGAGFAKYVGKGFAAYVGKGFTAEGGQEVLGLNGGRLGHFSRGFFGVTDSGHNLGVREAERMARQAEGRMGSWVLVAA